MVLAHPGSAVAQSSNMMMNFCIAGSSQNGFKIRVISAVR
jgi:hypothetical protein